jgi:hypothetical protein
MMFFAIVSRAEPRWIESSVYNILNLIIGLALLGATLWLNAHAKSRIRIIHDKVFLNQRDISSILSPQENSIILAFLRSHQNSLNCWELSLVLRTSDTEDESNHPHCKDCVEGFWKATSCSTYRNYKNRIKDVKKYLELSQIGTIVPVSENPREIKEAGWVLRFFDDVGLEKMPRLSHLFEHVPE